MGSNEKFIIKGIVDVCQKLDQKGFGANHDGNVSVKYGDAIYATPTAMSKGDITSDTIITLDMSGNKIGGYGKPFSEVKLHLAAYRSRPDVNAIVHAHPPYSTARGLVGLPLDKPGIPESVVSIGDKVPVAPFAMPGDAAGDDIVARMLEVSNVFMMPGNGVLSVGTDLNMAYLRLELVEHLAKIEQIARELGEPMVLSNSDIDKLLDKRAAAGLAPPKDLRVTSHDSRVTTNVDIQTIIEEEVTKVLSSLSK